MRVADKGWIKLHRSIVDHWVFQRGSKGYEMEHYWLDLLLMVNHKKGKIQYYKDVVTIYPGQTRTSQRKLAARWGIDTKTVKKVLDTFQNEGMITYENRYNGTLITIVNYLVYQGLSGQNGSTVSYTDSYTDSYTEGATVSHTDSLLTRMNKNELKNDKEPKNTASPFKDPWGRELE
jgi:DNA replication protein DnaD